MIYGLNKILRWHVITLNVNGNRISVKFNREIHVQDLSNESFSQLE